MESCLEHLKKYNEAVVDLVEGNEKLHNQVDKRAKEMEELKGRVCHEIQFYGLSFLVLSLSILIWTYQLTFLLRTTFLISIFLLTSHQRKGTKNNQAWDYSQSANSNKSTV